MVDGGFANRLHVGWLVSGVMLATALLLGLAGSARAAVLANWGGAGTVSAFVQGVAVGADGAVYVADPAGARIRVFTRDGAPLRDWGGPGSGPAAFDGLVGVAVGPDGDVYASDGFHVQRFAPDGTFKTRWGGYGHDRGEFRWTGGIAVGPDGTVYVSDRENERVQAFTADGTYLRSLRLPDDDDEHHAHSSTSDEHELEDPRGVAVEADGDVIVAEADADRLVRFAADGTPKDSWRTPGVVGVAVAPNGTILATDKVGHVVRRYDAGGAFLARLGSGATPESEPGERLNRPLAVATDCRGAVYVADASAKRIHVFGEAGLLAPPCIAPPPPPPPPPPPQQQIAPIVVVSQAPDPEPTLGASGVGEPVSGRVFVRKPGENRYSALLKKTKLPVGTEVDVRDGHIRIRFATALADRATYGPTQEGEFWGGEFKFFQSATGSLVDVVLSGDQPECDDASASARSSATGKKNGSRFVWGKAKGRFRTSGNHGAATVRGTYWFTEDRCDGTFFRTREGRVDVSDFGKRRTVAVTAGERYLARAPCESRRRFSIKLNVPVGVAIADAQVKVNGKRVKVRRGDRLTARVDLRGRPKQRVRVRIRLTTTAGDVLSGQREYQTCTPRRPDRDGPPTL